MTVHGSTCGDGIFSSSRFANPVLSKDALSLPGR
jgi:hypothetical protein